MGYTHYWYRQKELDAEAFINTVNDFNKMLPVLEHLGVKLAGGLGEGSPVINDQEITFNGLSKCGHVDRDLGITWPAKNASGTGTVLSKQNNLSAVDSKTDVSGSWFAGAELQRRTCGGHCDHETFNLEQNLQTKIERRDGTFYELEPTSNQDKNTRGKYFDCCKTAYKPYDLGVNIILIVAKQHLKDQIVIHSDGTLEQWQDAINICQHILGYGQAFKLDSEDETEPEQKQEVMPERKRAVIYTLTMWDKDNYIQYSDSDSSVDYFHSYSLTTKDTIEWLLKDAADSINVDPGNNEDLPKYDKRAARFAKALNYDLEKKYEECRGFDGHEWKKIQYILMKKQPSAPAAAEPIGPSLISDGAIYDKMLNAKEEIAKCLEPTDFHKLCKSFTNYYERVKRLQKKRDSA